MIFSERHWETPAHLLKPEGDPWDRQVALRTVAPFLGPAVRWGQCPVHTSQRRYHQHAADGSELTIRETCQVPFAGLLECLFCLDARSQQLCTSFCFSAPLHAYDRLKHQGVYYLHSSSVYAEIAILARNSFCWFFARGAITKSGTASSTRSIEAIETWRVLQELLAAKEPAIKQKI